MPLLTEWRSECRARRILKEKRTSCIGVAVVCGSCYRSADLQGPLPRIYEMLVQVMPFAKQDSTSVSFHEQHVSVGQAQLQRSLGGVSLNRGLFEGQFAAVGCSSRQHLRALALPSHLALTWHLQFLLTACSKFRVLPSKHGVGVLEQRRLDAFSLYQFAPSSLAVVLVGRT